MSKWNEVAHFLYGRGFWYADPLQEIDGLTEDELFWIPYPNSHCILWHVGHITHRERAHIGKFLQGLSEPVIPREFEVFNSKSFSPSEIQESVGSAENVMTWTREVREQSHAYIATLRDEDFHIVPETSAGGLSVAHWLFITASHTALHIGRIQLLRALLGSTGRATG